MKNLSSKIMSLVILLTLCTAQDDGNSNLSGSIGSVTFGGQVYNQIAFRPEIPIGTKMAIGLDIYLYIDGDGNIYKDAWNFKDGKSTLRTLMDKVYYFRYGRPEDDFYLRAGAIPSATLGQGILVDGYSNVIEYPFVRQIGANVKFKKDVMGFEAIVSNIKRVPGVLGLRTSFEYIPKLEIGISFVTDLDQNAGLKDRDSDGYPDVFDDFPDDEDLYDKIDADRDMWSDAYFQWNPDSTDAAFDMWFNNTSFLNRNPYNPADVDKDQVSGAAFDVTYQLTDKIQLYSQFAQLFGDTKAVDVNENTSLGYGFVPLGISSHWGPVNFRAEYRQNSRKFLFNYWNGSYDVNRATYDFTNEKIVTREYDLYKYGELKGFFLQADASLFELLKLQLGYQDMSGEVWDSIISDYVTDNNKLFRTGIKINTNKVPKVKLAEAFYEQSDVANPFKFDPSPSTVFGYDVGIEISSGVILVYKARRTYHYVSEGVLEPSNSIQFETQMVF
ncbi:MAG: hypothetical protein HQ510_09570 [Candidatus Marinimicrobia bacterium]|nr:hypothetical protein [Candidatus Neomarinimicrobiota bacterium]